MCDPFASVPSRSPRPLAGSPAQPSTNSLPTAPPPLHPAPRSNRAPPSPLPVGQASRPAGSWGLRPQADLTGLHQIPASKDSSPLSFGPARGRDRRLAPPLPPRKTKENQTRDSPLRPGRSPPPRRSLGRKVEARRGAGLPAVPSGLRCTPGHLSPSSSCPLCSRPRPHSWCRRCATPAPACSGPWGVESAARHPPHCAPVGG